MFKKVILFSIAVNFVFTSFSQDTKSDFFYGGGFVAGFGGANGGTALTLGIIPEVGYTIAKPLDIGLSFNCVYSTITYYQGFDRIRQNSFNYGIGAFTRLHITDGLFIQGIAEQNFINYTVKYADAPSIEPYKEKVSTLNALVGIGWGQRIVGESGFYSAILLDVNRDINSPYTNRGQAIPIFRAGFIKYFGKKKSR